MHQLTIKQSQSDIMLIWDNADANVRVFLRDETGAQVDRDTDSNSLSMLSVIAETGGQRSIAVQVDSNDTVNDDILVDVTSQL